MDDIEIWDMWSFRAHWRISELVAPSRNAQAGHLRARLSQFLAASDADRECVHGALPHDPNITCRCWMKTVLLELTEDEAGAVRAALAEVLAITPELEQGPTYRALCVVDEGLEEAA